MKSKFFKKQNIIYFCIGLVLIVLFISYASRLNTSVNISGHNWKSYETQVKDHDIQPAGKILEVSLSFDSLKSPKVTITGLAQKNGYASNGALKNDAYTVQLLNSSDSLIYQQLFNIPNQVYYDNINPDKTLSGGKTVLPQVSFALTLPWHENATQIRIIDDAGQEILRSTLQNIQIINNQPHFNSIRGDELLDDKSNKLNMNLFQSAAAQTTGGQLNIALIGNGYTDVNAFHTDANNFSQKFLTFEPYKTRASQIKFNVVDSTTNLQCSYSGRLATCNDQLVTQTVNNAGAQHDGIGVINNSSTYGGSGGGDIAVQYNGSDGAVMFVHEYGGHSFGMLLDEYVYAGESSSGTIDNQIHGIGMKGDGNCYAGSPPVAGWANLVQTADYKNGCDNTTNWTSPAKDSLMNSLTAPSFDLVSQCVINRQLDKKAGAFAGSNSQCYSGGTVSGTPTSNPSSSVNPTSATSPTTTVVATSVPTINPGTSPMATTMPSGFVCIGSCPTSAPTQTVINTKPTAAQSTLAPTSISNPTQIIAINPTSVVNGGGGGGGGTTNSQGLLSTLFDLIQQLFRLLLRIFRRY